MPVCNKTVIKSDMLVLVTSRCYPVIDGIYDTGYTCRKVAQAFAGFNCDFAFCMSRHKSHVIAAKVLVHNKWIVFPRE